MDDVRNTPVACIGSGTVGRSWAMLFARNGCQVTIYDSDPAALESALAFVGEAGSAVEKRVAITTSLARVLADAVYVQESTAEDLAAKRALFVQLDALAGPHTAFGSSTSTLPGSAFLGGLGISPRCLVVHPTNPPHLVPLVELCRTSETDEEVFRQVRAFMAACGQSPVEIRRETFGFALNRLQAALVAEALTLVADDVVSPADLDKIVTRGLGLRWALTGPFETGHLNAPGGYADYMTKFWTSWEGLFSAIGREIELDRGLVAKIDSALRGARPEDIETLQRRRDGALQNLRTFLDSQEPS